jgi:rhodanese-related sulfurtransferase
LAGSLPDSKPNAQTPSSCPIVCGGARLLSWAALRVPHALRAAALLLVTLVAAAVYNAATPFGIPWGPSPDNRVGIPRVFESRLPQIDAAKALSLYEAGEALFVDSRDEDDYERDHIPGAVSAPMRRWAEIWPDIESEFPRDRLLVLYCYGAHCGLSTRQGKELLRQEYGKLVVLDYGWSAWTDHGHPTVEHPEGHPGEAEGEH